MEEFNQFSHQKQEFQHSSLLKAFLPSADHLQFSEHLTRSPTDREGHALNSVQSRGSWFSSDENFIQASPAPPYNLSSKKRGNRKKMFLSNIYCFPLL